MGNFLQLSVWQKANELSVELHRFRWHYGKSPGLAGQIRRAAASIAANIAEGASQATDELFISRINIAIGECRELENHLIFARQIEATIYGDLDWAIGALIEVRKMLYGLRRYLQGAGGNVADRR